MSKCIRLSHRPEPSAVKPCSPRGGQWIGHSRTTWSTACSSAPHSQAAEEAILNLYKQERKHPTPVRISRTQALLGRVIPGGVGVGDENAESCWVVRPLRIPLVIRPVRRMYVVVVRWTYWVVVRRVQVGGSISGAVHLHSVDGWALSGEGVQDQGSHTFFKFIFQTFSIPLQYQI